MPAAVPIALAVVAATTVYQGVEANQQAQHAKGAAQAQQTAMDAQIKDATAADESNKKTQADAGATTQARAMAAIRAAMSSGSGMGGTILTGGQGAAPAPTQQKTLLGA